MKVETWIPLVTFILGLAGAQITEVLKDRRTSNRERQARQAELQRSTLLDLQDAVLALRNLVDVTRTARFMAKLGSRTDLKAREEAWQAQEQFHEALAKVTLLNSRVLDDKARHDLTLFVAHAQLALAQEVKEPEDLYGRELTDLYVDVMDQLGELLRERY